MRGNIRESRLDSVWYTLALWLALGWLWLGTYAFADVWTNAKPPPLATKSVTNPAINKPKTAKTPTTAVTKSVTKTVAGHYHRCYRCGNEWGHTSASHGNSRAHHCPACGAGPVWSISRYGPVKLQLAKPVATFKTAPPCPT
jgi:DNA-directed RNA polymerase subunit RPC12/RpoP